MRAAGRPLNVVRRNQVVADQPVLPPARHGALSKVAETKAKKDKEGKGSKRKKGKKGQKRCGSSSEDSSSSSSSDSDSDKPGPGPRAGAAALQGFRDAGSSSFKPTKVPAKIRKAVERAVPLLPKASTELPASQQQQPQQQQQRGQGGGGRGRGWYPSD
ncbi:hypothetical protein HYH03_015075 [Edaphochlamys debaryana]|uniref:Uncharacterized protein n=1 Tax=Edaphochlamys debaryana TaxID=47281 RepID=A0A836BRC1_9CHLO|nr:hypothetical protein HYH03_015075 [Edaphochlamys debaryana]|eukprot:KAG2486251.1 hypothetical protein HYH03_015075 [Edaphochlamys debaryana]